MTNSIGQIENFKEKFRQYKLRDIAGAARAARMIFSNRRCVATLIESEDLCGAVRMGGTQHTYVFGNGFAITGLDVATFRNAVTLCSLATEEKKQFHQGMPQAVWLICYIPDREFVKSKINGQSVHI